MQAGQTPPVSKVFQAWPQLARPQIVFRRHLPANRASEARARRTEAFLLLWLVVQDNGRNSRGIRKGAHFSDYARVLVLRLAMTKPITS